MNENVLQRAISVYGAEHQMRMCMEECAELIVEIIDYMEIENRNELFIIEEIADVLVTTNQMKMIFKAHCDEIALNYDCITKENKQRIVNNATKSLAELIKLLNKCLRGCAFSIPYFDLKLSQAMLYTKALIKLLEIDGISNVEDKVNEQIEFKVNRLESRMNGGEC